MRPCPWCSSGKPRRFSGAREGLLLCGGCRCAYWGTPWSPEETERHYDGYYPDDGRPPDPLTEKRYHSILDRFERRMAPGRLLDVGCGKGDFLAAAESRGWQAAGCELSRSAGEHLQELKARKGLAFSVFNGPLAQARFPAGSFDAVTLFEVIEHLEDPLAAVQEAHRLLKGNGILYLTTPNIRSLSRILLGGRWRVIDEEHRILLSPGALAAQISRIGLAPAEMTTKNLDLAEILAVWRNGRTPVHPARPESSSQRLRRRLESGPLLKGLKQGANRLLGLLQAGDTIELLAVKRLPPTPPLSRGTRR